jgi:hypothetical protein
MELRALRGKGRKTLSPTGDVGEYLWPVGVVQELSVKEGGMGEMGRLQSGCLKNSSEGDHWLSSIVSQSEQSMVDERSADEDL